jgi:23S rRNA (adenine2503-C2)-methyltransferase
LSKGFRKDLSEGGWYISRVKRADRLVDADGTVKYVFELLDGGRIETVLLRDDGRRTLCISTQAGCGMRCVFCATGKLRLRRNLTAAEIVGQVYAVRGDKQKINNVVYMGMGEPLENYDAVMRSVRILNHAEGENIGVRHLTISTCGISPGIEKLGGEDIGPRLAVSLNAPTDGLRTELMPINRKYPLASVMKAVKGYQFRTRRRVTFEYVLIKGLNDSVVQARMFAKLLGGVKCNVNLIEYNPHPGCEFVGSGRARMERFGGVVEEAGIETTLRFKRGVKIRAGCGQLGADRLVGSSEKG